MRSLRLCVKKNETLPPTRINTLAKAGFEKPLVNFASGLSDDLIGAELDNQSDGSIADLVIRLCDQVASVFVLVRANPDEPPGVTLKLIQHLLRKEEKFTKLF